MRDIVTIKDSYVNKGIAIGEKNGIEIGRAEGIEKGRAEGIEKGRKNGILIGEEKKATEIAKNLKRLGIDINAIVEATGLSKEEIDAIKIQ